MPRSELRLGPRRRRSEARSCRLDRGGFVAIGEPFWHQEGIEADGFVDLAATVERFQSAGLALTGLIAASKDDWDRYESLHWRALEEWLASNPEHPEASAIRDQHVGFRDNYLRQQRAQLGWAIFAGRMS